MKLDDGRVALGAGLGLLLIYALTEAIVESVGWHPIWPAALLLHLIRDLGIAFVVGAIVSLGIERISRARLNSDIHKQIQALQVDFIGSAFMKQYPEGYSALIANLLKTEIFCRLEHTVEIDIQHRPEQTSPCVSDDEVYFDQITRGFVKNVSSVSQTYQPKFFLGEDWDLKAPHLDTWKVGDRELSRAEIAKADQSTPDSPFTKWYQFPEPIEIPPGGTVYTYTKARNYKRARDVTTWSGILAADGLRFTVTHPPDFEVFVQAKSPNRLTEFPSQSDGRRVAVEIFGGTLPHTTVELGWRPKLSDL